MVTEITIGGQANLKDPQIRREKLKTIVNQSSKLRVQEDATNKRLDYQIACSNFLLYGISFSVIPIAYQEYCFFY